MANTVVGIRFKAVGKKYYFDPAGLDLKVHDNVIVETVRGVELGEIIEEAKVIEDSEVISTLKPILRLATNDDLMAYERNQKDIAPTLERVKFHVKQNKLDMKLLGCEYTLDRSKLIIYFNAEGRVDFRELVKDLANEFKLRIELRQVGTRDGAKFLGGIGPCGYLLCCNTFLGDFDTVSIKMAKNQNLSLNPANISGLCGKLLCCIRYEDDLYTEYRKATPKIGTYVKTVDGRGRVISANIINQSVRIQTPEEGIRSYQISDLVDIEEYDLKEDNHGE
ncbi:MAG: PSP1 domain-containing protein [Candidatus Izemoplasmataceae bacterium]